MKQFAKAFDRQPHWVQPRTMKRHYELRDGDDLFASLTFQSTFGSMARATSAAGEWTFKRMGFFRPRVTVRKAGTDVDLAVYRPRWSGTSGTLEFAGGDLFHFDTSNFWATRFELQDAKGHPLIQFHKGAGNAGLSDFFKIQARVEILPAGQEIEFVSLLVMLAWYLVILQQEDSAVVVVAAT